MNPYKELSYHHEQQPPSITTLSVMHSYAHSNHGFIDFNLTRLDQASFPVRTWNKILKEELKGCIWRKWSGNALDMEEISSKSEWFEILADIFNEPLVTIP
ncbi:hypothetical protein [Paenibacillus lautus]|uniref:hypothetical protein n=1 Tax=Paenibacillus lautus TaxID=1401 RepID=UPI003D26C702